MHIGPPEGQAKVSGGPPPQEPDLSMEVGVNLYIVSMPVFYVFLSLRVFSLGLFLVRLALILKML